MSKTHEEAVNDALMAACVKRLETITEEMDKLPWWAFIRQHEYVLRMRLVRESLEGCIARAYDLRAGVKDE